MKRPVWPDPGAMYCVALPDVAGHLFTTNRDDAERVARQLGPNALLYFRDDPRNPLWRYVDGRRYVPADPPRLTSDDPDAPSLWGPSQETLDLW